MGQEREPQERRKQNRYKKAIIAVCEFGNSQYRARTYDISEQGITLLTGPDVPELPRYKVRCRLPSGTEALFEVEEKQRRLLRRGEYSFLRLGLNIVNESLDIVIFFRELAELEVENEIRRKVQQPSKGQSGDRSARLTFQLPVLAKAADAVFRCETLDMGSWGLAVLAPDDFPTADSFSLVCLDPDGHEIPIKAREMNRKTLPGGGVRVGFMVVAGEKGFRGFVEKYARW